MIEQAETVTDEQELDLSDLDAVVGGLTKVGTGTLILSVNNTYTGSTRVEQGIIAV